MAMNKQRRTSNINNIVTYDTLKNVTIPANLTVKGITQAGFVKSDGNGLFSVDTTVYQAALPSQTGNGGKFLTTNGSALSWGSVSTSPAGSNTQIQYNNSGVFGASAGLSYTASGNLLVGTTDDSLNHRLRVAGTGYFSNNVTVIPVGGGTINIGAANTVFKATDSGGYARIDVAQQGILNNRTIIGGGNLGANSIKLDSTGTYFDYPPNQSTVDTWIFSRPFNGGPAGGVATLVKITSTNNVTPLNGATTLKALYINPTTTDWTRVIAIENTVGDVTLNTTSGSTIIGGNTNVSSAILNIISTTKGILPPRMTAAQKTAISSPAAGLVIYQTDSTEGLYQYKSTGWEAIGGGTGGVTAFNTRTGAVTLLSTDVTSALGYTPVTNARTITINGTSYDLSSDRAWTISDTNIFNTSGTLTGHRYIYGGSWTFTIQDINTLTVDTTSVTNSVAVFKATEPNVTIQAMGASNGAALFLSPSNSGINGSIHNRTGGGLEFYVGATPSVKQTIKASGQVQFNGYTSTGSFSGTAAGYLGFDSSGNIITTTGVGGITLTTTGSSGAATWDGTTLNIPVYSGGGGGSVTTVSVVSANGFAGSVANATSTPAITLTTTINGILKGNSTAISAATAGLDYQAPITLTTTGSTANATFSSNTLNVPNYSLSNLYNANGTLSGNRTINSGGFTMAIQSRVSIGTTTAPSSLFDLAVNGVTDTGGISLRGTTFTTSTTATLDRGLYVFSGGAGQTLTLQDSTNQNTLVIIKNNSASALTVSAAASRFIQLKTGTNVSTYSLATNDTIFLISNGLNHYIQI